MQLILLLTKTHCDIILRVQITLLNEKYKNTYNKINITTCADHINVKYTITKEHATCKTLNVERTLQN